MDREKLTQALAKEYYATDTKTASRKAGEIKAFYETDASTVFVVMDRSQYPVENHSAPLQFFLTS